MPFDQSPHILHALDAQFARAKRAAVAHLRDDVMAPEPAISPDQIAASCVALRGTYLGNTPVLASVLGILASETPHTEYRDILVRQWKETVLKIPARDREPVIVVGLRNRALVDAAYECVRKSQVPEHRRSSARHAEHRLIA